MKHTLELPQITLLDKAYFTSRGLSFREDLDAEIVTLVARIDEVTYEAERSDGSIIEVPSGYLNLIG
jgi:hypothetical protein